MYSVLVMLGMPTVQFSSSSQKGPSDSGSVDVGRASLNWLRRGALVRAEEPTLRGKFCRFYRGRAYFYSFFLCTPHDFEIELEGDIGEEGLVFVACEWARD